MPDWRAYAERVAADGRTVVVTHGADGSSAVGPGGAWVDAEAQDVEVVDANGAGDAFFAGFLVARWNGSDLRGSLDAGAARAVVCLSGPHLAGEVGGLHEG
nr:PfkB family carbohydrate kinase [Nocardioides sp. zg-1308]